MLFQDLPEDFQEIFQETRLQERLRQLLEFEPEPAEPSAKRRRVEETDNPNDRIYALLIIEIRCRNAFKKLLNAWLKQRADKIPLSNIDTITLAPYSQPLIVYNLNQRSRHCFETKTLITNIFHQLRYSFGGFPKPMTPLNPITNLPFSSGQLLHIFDSALRLGYYSKEFMAFRAAAFDINLYNYLQERPLRFAAIQEFIYGPNHQHLMLEELTNFIVASGNKRSIHLSGLEIGRLSFGLRRPCDYINQWLRIFAEYLQYDLKGTQPVRYCPEQIKKSRALSSEVDILVSNLRNYVASQAPAYNIYLAERRQAAQAAQPIEVIEEEEEEVYDELEEEDDTVIFAGGTIDTTFQLLLQRLLGPGGPLHR